MSRESEEKTTERKSISNAFESINDELEFYKKKYEDIESELFKSKLQNKKLESQIRKLQDLLALNTNNKNNTSISMFLPSEFKTQWEIMNKESLLEAFENIWDSHIWISHISQDTFKIVYENSQNTIKDMIFFILKYLNFKIENESMYDLFLPKFRNIFQEYFSTIFIFKEEILVRIKERIKTVVTTEYKDFNLIDEFNKDIESKGFKNLIEILHKLFIYMILHDPIITINISSYSERELEYRFFSKNEHLCIEGFFKNKTPCVIVIPPPMLRKNFPFQGIKPAVYLISNPEEKITQICEERYILVQENIIEDKDTVNIQNENQTNILASSHNINKSSYSAVINLEGRNDNILKSPSVSKSNDFGSSIKEFTSFNKDVNNFPKKSKDINTGIKTTINEEKTVRVSYYKERSTSSLDIVIDGDFIESPDIIKEKNCFDHPFSKQKTMSKRKLEKQGTFREDNTKSYSSSSIKSFKNKTQKSCDKEVNKSQKDINSRSSIVINSARTINNENQIKEDNEIYNVYQTTSNDNCNEEKLQDLVINISNSFAFIRQKNLKQNKVDRQLSTKLPKEQSGNSSEKVKFSNTGYFSSNILNNDQFSTNKTNNKDNYYRVEITKDQYARIDKTKFEKEMQANLRRIYTHNNKINFDQVNQRKLRTLTEKYFNISPKFLKVNTKLKNEVPNRESIKQFYEEYLSKGFNKTNFIAEGNQNIIYDNHNEAGNSKHDKHVSFFTPKSANKTIQFNHSKTLILGDKANSNGEYKDSVITQHGSSVEPSLNKMNTYFSKDNDSKEKNLEHNTNTNENLDIKGSQIRKKIEYTNLKVSKNFRSKIGRLSNLKACTQIITDQKLDPRKQSSVKPKVKLCLNNND